MYFFQFGCTRLILEAAETAGEPDIHTACTTMVPGIVRDECYAGVLCGETAFGRDGGLLSRSGNGSHLKGLAIALLILDAIGGLHFELGFSREQQVMRIDTFVVSPLGTID